MTPGQETKRKKVLPVSKKKKGTLRSQQLLFWTIQRKNLGFPISGLDGEMGTRVPYLLLWGHSGCLRLTE